MLNRTVGFDLNFRLALTRRLNPQYRGDFIRPRPLSETVQGWREQRQHTETRIDCSVRARSNIGLANMNISC